MFRKRILTILAAVVALGVLLSVSGAAFAAGTEGEVPAVSSPPVPADMSGYGLPESDPCFVRISLKEAVDLFRNGGSGLILFTADWCPFCLYAVPILEDALLEGGMTAFLVDADDVDHEADAEAYEELCSYLATALKPHEDGTLLDIPEVLAVKDGTIVGHHFALLPSFRTPQVRAREEMTQEQKDELRSLYAELIVLLSDKDSGD